MVWLDKIIIRYNDLTDKWSMDKPDVIVATAYAYKCRTCHAGLRALPIVIVMGW